MFNPIFKENVQGRKHPGKVKNGHKDPNDTHIYHDENRDEIEFYQGISKKDHIMTLNTRISHSPKNSPINCDDTWYLYSYYVLENAEI